ncbi:MAG TPA: alpha/beta hydrolase [Thermomicrobiales bacterium]|jgi:pimeloyl-ACP methyl ester carboxylesterase
MFLPINGQRINVVAFGPGPRTIIGVGGWAGNWELWQQPFEELSRTWRTVAYDHRGAGETVVPIAEITTEGLVADVFGVMDALSIERCVVGAESSGARTALLAALERPERIEGLVLIDGSYLGSPVRDHDPLGDLLRSDFEAAIYQFMERCTPGEGLEHIRRWGRDILRRSRAVAAVRLRELGDTPDITERLAEIHIPTLIIHSARDQIVPVTLSEQLAARIVGSKIVVLDSDCHVPTMTDAEQVVTAIEEFFGHT